jgi:Virulence activator alpha C-term
MGKTGEFRANLRPRTRTVSRTAAAAQPLTQTARQPLRWRLPALWRVHVGAHVVSASYVGSAQSSRPPQTRPDVRLSAAGRVRGVHRRYEITDAGRGGLATWFATPTGRTDRPRDELVIKLALALTTPGVDVRVVVQTQRGATMRTLQEYTRLKAGAEQPADLSWLLVLDAMIFQAEAEVRWLDRCEASLVRYTAPPAAAPRVVSEPEVETASGFLRPVIAFEEGGLSAEPHRLSR